MWEGDARSSFQLVDASTLLALWWFAQVLLLLHWRPVPIAVRSPCFNGQSGSVTHIEPVKMKREG